MSRTRRWGLVATLAALSLFAGCGDSSGGRTEDDAIGTLAYVQSSCDESVGEFRFSQTLHIRHGDEERTILELELPAVPARGLCLQFGRSRDGKGSLFVGVFQRIGVSPDGELVVFEVNDDFSATSKNFLSAEQEGIFSVAADGSGLKRIAAASRYPNSNLLSADPVYTFGADGETIAFSDIGPGPEGEDGGQIFLLDVESGARTQLTRLPSAAFYVAYPTFLGGEQLGFLAAGIGEAELFTVRLDGSDLSPIPPLTSSPNGAVVPSFQITGLRVATRGDFPGETPENPEAFGGRREAFVTDGANTVQITNFNRSDTARYGTVLSPDGARIYFTASVDLGDNPMEMCQVFSASVLGGDIRQLTRFSQDHPSRRGCAAAVSDGCSAGLSFAGGGTDTRTGLLIFDSSCDPFGTAPFGEQIFAIQPDGSGLQQLTQARGFIRGDGQDGFTELPGPWAYGPHS